MHSKVPRKNYSFELELLDFKELEQLARRSRRSTASYLRCLIKAHLYTMRLLEPERFAASFPFANDEK